MSSVFKVCLLKLTAATVSYYNYTIKNCIFTQNLSRIIHTTTVLDYNVCINTSQWSLVVIHCWVITMQQSTDKSLSGLCYSNTTVYYGIHEHSVCIPVDCGVTNLIHDRRSCVDFMLEVQANMARCVHSSVNKPGVKRNSGLWDVYPLQTLLWRYGDKSRSWIKFDKHHTDAVSYTLIVTHWKSHSCTVLSNNCQQWKKQLNGDQEHN